MAAKAITVGRKNFNSRAKATEFVQAIIQSHPTGLDVLSGEHLQVAEDLLAMHPQRDEKLRGGYAGMVVKRAAEKSTRCFAVVREDGGYEEFSYRVALNPALARPSLACAARGAVDEDIFAFKKQAFDKGPFFCAVTGAQLSMADAHVDHAPPATFHRILAEIDDTNPNRALDHEGTKDVFFFLADRDAFRAFHNARAELRIVHRKVNLTLKQPPMAD